MPLDKNVPVAIFSLEMPAPGYRYADVSHPNPKIDFGRLPKPVVFSEEHWNPLSKAAARLGKAPILINDNRGTYRSESTRRGDAA